jgi:hypothetical protein
MIFIINIFKGDKKETPTYPIPKIVNIDGLTKITLHGIS